MKDISLLQLVWTSSCLGRDVVWYTIIACSRDFIWFLSRVAFRRKKVSPRDLKKRKKEEKGRWKDDYKERTTRSLSSRCYILTEISITNCSYNPCGKACSKAQSAQTEKIEMTQLLKRRPKDTTFKNVACQAHDFPYCLQSHL